MLCILQDDVAKYVKEMLAKFGTQGYIANLGHGMYPDMDPDAVAAFFDAVYKVSLDMNANS